MTAPMIAAHTQDTALRERARTVIPGGMYGHLDVKLSDPDMPQFFQRASGSRVWDVDGNEYVDLMGSWGPVILGHQDPEVEAAADAQRRLGDCLNGPAPCMVELAETLVGLVRHADWAMFAKNGTDATTLCLTIARAATGRSKILVARGSYHGAAPWCTPRPAGVVPEDRAHLLYYTYNDAESVREAAAAAGPDLAGIIVCPFRHDAGFDQELVRPEFARALREICTRAGAALILDDVRCCLRLSHGSSWDGIGVEPDLSAWSKALGNGHPIAAVLGRDALRDAATQLFTTGSFWYAAVPMAAAVATLGALKQRDGVACMVSAGQLLRDGLARQAAQHGLVIRQTGPVQMPFMTFANDPDMSKSRLFAVVTTQHGAFLHPRHNWFLSVAHTPSDIARVLDATDQGFRAVRHRFGEG